MFLHDSELAITANRKNTDQHIVLFGWSQDDKKEAAVIDILRDTLCPKIALQGVQTCRLSQLQMN